MINSDSTSPGPSAAERHRLLVEWNQTARGYPLDQGLHELIEHQVARTPDAIAVVSGGKVLTYRELNERANQLALHLQHLGVGPEVLVGICVERSLELVVGLLAILKAGGAYLPLDPEYPRERLAFMLADAQAPVLLIQQTLTARLPAHSARTVRIDSDWELIAQEGEERPLSRVTGDNLAYVIYTSGSTGKPKGVMNVHRGICNRLLWMQDAYRLTAADRVLQKTPFSFDVSVWEFFWPLLVGARVVMARPGGHRDSAYLLKLISEQQITTLHFVPSMLQLFLEEPDLTAAACLRRVFCSGEALPKSLQDRFFERLEAKLHNLYGPTEASVDVTFWACRPEPDQLTVPIGRPIANTQIYLLDPELRPVPIGVPGELYIGGVGLARGYLNRPELTAQRFIPHPFPDLTAKSAAPAPCRRVEAGGRLYKTGDLARYRPDGAIEFLGRGDQQVKIHGVRIELGEIEGVLAQHPAIRESLVLARDEPPEGQRLVAYIVPCQGQAPEFGELRRFLKEQLPDYMVPGAIVSLAALPLTPNGKVDRQALPPPNSSRPELECGPVAPRDRLERQIARLWEEVLGIRPIGVQDSFFDLGGNSLLAARMFARIGKMTGQQLPVAALFQAPTVEQLVRLLRRDGTAGLQSSLIPIQPSGRQLPLFCIHSVWGNVLCYRELARHLGPDQPVYGLRAPDGRGNVGVQVTLESMAAHGIAEIRSLQPAGPYFLAGFSFGGVLAYEMAQQLHQEGQHVALLALLDTIGPGLRLRPPAQRCRRHIIQWAQLGGRERLLYGLARAKAASGRLEARWWRLTRTAWAKLGHPRPYSHRDIPWLNLQAELNYVPCGYPGRLTIFRASEQPVGWYYDPELGWGGLSAGGLEIYMVPGDHETLLQEPQVRALAEQLAGCLRRSRQGRRTAAGVSAEEGELARPRD